MLNAPENPAAAAIAARNGGTSADEPIWRPGTTPHPFRTAMERRDIDAVIATLREDVVAKSPVTPRPFFGIHEVGGLLKNLIDGFDELEYTDELTSGYVYAVRFSGVVLGKTVTGVDILRLDEMGRLREVEVHARPPSGVLAMAAKFTPMFAHWRRGPVRAVLALLLLRPAPLFAIVVDWLGSRLARVPRERE